MFLDMKLYQEFLFETNYQSIICKSYLCVAHYKKGKYTEPRLAVAATMEVTPFFGMQTEMDNWTFIRLFHLPCQFQAILLQNKCNHFGEKLLLYVL